MSSPRRPGAVDSGGRAAAGLAPPPRGGGSEGATPALDARLIDRLTGAGVRVEVKSPDTALLRAVPANDRVFTKARTNLLLTRPRRGLPFLLCVDEDLAYTGDDADLLRAFAAARRQQGWRVLPLIWAPRLLQPALEQALEVLAGEGTTGPSAAEPSHEGLLGAHGADLTARQAGGRGETTVGRADEIDRIAACLGRLRAVLPVVVAPAGAGKTNLLHGLAQRLLERAAAVRLVVVDLGDLFAGQVFAAERENVLRALLAEASRPSLVVALEHLELVFLEAPHGPLLLEAALERGARIVATALPALSALAEDGALGGRLERIVLGEPGPQATALVLREAAARVAAHHGIVVDEDDLELVVEQALALPGHLPGKAVALLDRAAARAALLGDPRLNAVHVHLAAGQE